MDNNSMLKNQAKKLAKVKLNKMSEEEINLIGNKQRKIYLILSIVVLIISISASIYCTILLKNFNGTYFLYAILFYISFAISIYLVISTIKKSNYNYALQKLQNDFMSKPELMQLVSQEVADDMNKFHEIEISNGLFAKNKIFVNNEEQTISFEISKVKSRAYKFEDILRYEVNENGSNVVKGTAGKALVGGLFFGLGGAIVGSSMSKKVEDKCEELSVSIYLNDISNSHIFIPILSAEVLKTSLTYSNAVSLAKEVCGILEFAMNKKSLEDSTNETKTNQTTKEQIKELKEMLDEGLITQEDFEKKKNQILGL